MRTHSTRTITSGSTKKSSAILAMRGAIIALATIGIVATLIGTPNKILNPSGALCIHSSAGKSK